MPSRNAGVIFSASGDMKPEGRVIPNRRVGLRYAAGAISLLLLAAGIGSWAWILAWPALSMALVSVSYFWLGGGLYTKRNGKVGRISALLLAPARLGQTASLIYYRKHSHPWNEVIPGLWIGRKPSRSEARRLIEEIGVNRVLDLTAEFSEPGSLVALDYLNLPVPDLTAPTPKQLAEGSAFILHALAAGQTVYVHCKVGYSRSAAIAANVLVISGHCRDIPEAFQRLRDTRPGIVIRPEIHKALSR